MNRNRILLWLVLFDLALIVAALLYFSDQFQMPEVMRPYWTKVTLWLRDTWPTTWPGNPKPWLLPSR